MNKIYLLVIGLFCSLLGLKAQSQSQSESLDIMIKRGMEDHHIPGLIAAVYYKNQIVFSKAYGLSNVESKEKVDENTVFNLGSSTKSVVSMAMGILVDQGKLSWEDKVRDHLPEFRMSDPYITENARIKDLLIHNLGIDDIEILDSMSTQEVLGKFAMAPKTAPFRGGFYYSNLAYVIAGEVIGEVSGKHWSTFVTDEIFTPLNMDKTFTVSRDILSYDNYATPYYYFEDEGYRSHPLTLDDEVGACGNIWSCLSDMEHYLEMLVDGGIYKGQKILESETFDYLFKPHTIESIHAIHAIYSVVKPTWRTYGLGWFQHDYRGEKIDFHPGNINGLNAIVGVMHSKDISVVVFANRDWAELRHAILYKAVDLWAFDDDSRDWHKEIFDADKELVTDRIAAYYKRYEERRIANTKPSFPIENYEGVYTHPMFGEAKVSITGTALEINFNDYLAFSTEHWHYDAFRGAPVGEAYDWIALFNFQIGPRGVIDSFLFMDEQFEKE